MITRALVSKSDPTSLGYSGQRGHSLPAIPTLREANALFFRHSVDEKSMAKLHRALPGALYTWYAFRLLCSAVGWIGCRVLSF
jgi:hypothetical protein